MNQARLSQNQYIGTKSNLFLKKTAGSIYVAYDTSELYIYNYLEDPILVGLSLSDIPELPEFLVNTVNGQSGNVIVENVSKTITISPDLIVGSTDVKSQVLSILNSLGYIKSIDTADLFVRVEDFPVDESEGANNILSYLVIESGACPPRTIENRNLYFSKGLGNEDEENIEEGDFIFEDETLTTPFLTDVLHLVMRKAQGVETVTISYYFDETFNSSTVLEINPITGCF